MANTSDPTPSRKSITDSIEAIPTGEGVAHWERIQHMRDSLKAHKRHQKNLPKEQRLNAADGAMLWSIFSHSNKDWEAWPSYQSLADAALVSKNWVEERVPQLKKFGWLEIIHKPGKSSTYKLTPHPFSRSTQSAGGVPHLLSYPPNLVTGVRSSKKLTAKAEKEDTTSVNKDGTKKVRRVVRREKTSSSESSFEADNEPNPLTRSTHQVGGVDVKQLDTGKILDEIEEEDGYASPKKLRGVVEGMDVATSIEIYNNWKASK